MSRGEIDRVVSNNKRPLLEVTSAIILHCPLADQWDTVVVRECHNVFTASVRLKPQDDSFRVLDWKTRHALYLF